MTLIQLTEVLQDIEVIIQMVETILRGKTNSVDLDQLLTLSDKAYEYFSDPMELEGISSNINDASRTKYLEIGVKLHNKARNLGQSQVAIRSNLKAACGWMFAAFGEKSAKVFMIVLKLLAKCGEDFRKFVGKNDRALACFETAISLWSNVERLELRDRLPPVDIQDMRIAVFRSHLGKGKILMNQTASLKDVKGTLTSAFEMVPSLHLRYRISFVELIMDLITKHFKSEPKMSEAINFYSMNLDVLEIPNDKFDENDEVNEQDELIQRKMELSIRSYLSLAFIHADNG
jgi:hypothetical protein